MLMVLTRRGKPKRRVYQAPSHDRSRSDLLPTMVPAMAEDPIGFQHPFHSQAETSW